MRETRTHDKAHNHECEAERLKHDAENIQQDAEQYQRGDYSPDDLRWPVVNLASSFIQFSADLAAFGFQQMGVVARALMGMNLERDTDRSHRHTRRPAETRV